MITLQTSGDDLVQKSFNKLTDPARRRQLMDAIGAFGVSSTQQRFIDQSDPEGNKWPESGRARTQGGKTLLDTGRLLQSITHEAGDDQAAWGTNVVYAAIHHFGGIIRAKRAKKLAFQGINGFAIVSQVTMPARPYLGLSLSDQNGIRDIAEDWFEGAVS